jgi:hypothetical protein
MNNLTACFLLRSKIPFDFPTDRACIDCGIETCWQPIPEKLKFCIIPNTLEVADLWVSAPLAAEARKNPNLEVSNELRPIPFDRQGNVVQEALFPHCVRAKRGTETRV